AGPAPQALPNLTTRPSTLPETSGRRAFPRNKARTKTMTTPDLRRRMAKLGFDSGPLDGIPGPQMNAALHAACEPAPPGAAESDKSAIASAREDGGNKAAGLRYRTGGGGLTR